MTNIGKGLKNMRKKQQLTLEQLSNKLNERYTGEFNFNKGKLSKWENDREEPRLSSVKMLADFYQVTVDELYEHSDEYQSITPLYLKLERPRQQAVYNFAKEQYTEQIENNVIPFPTPSIELDINGILSAGTGIFNFDKENPIKWVEVSYVPDDYDFAFEVNGESMQPFYQDGEVVFIKQVNEVHDGQIVAVEVSGEAFLKKVYQEEERLRFVSLNTKVDENGEPLYPDFYVYNLEEAHLIGRVVT